MSRHLPSNLPLYLLPSDLPMGLSAAGALFSSVRLQGKASCLQGNSISAGILPHPKAPNVLRRQSCSPGSWHCSLSSLRARLEQHLFAFGALDGVPPAVKSHGGSGRQCSVGREGTASPWGAAQIATMVRRVQSSRVPLTLCAAGHFLLGFSPDLP